MRQTDATIRIVKTNPNAVVPTYGTEGAAGFDLFAPLAEGESIVVEPGHMKAIDLGFKAAIEEGWAVDVTPRGGNARKFRITVQNTPGLIDEDYRGSWIVLLANEGPLPFIIGEKNKEGKWVNNAIAQGVLKRRQTAEFKVVESLDTTARNEGGFGSTNK